MAGCLVEAEALAESIGSGNIVPVDCRFNLLAPHEGFRAFCDGHVPGARYAHLDKDLARRPLPHEGRHPLPLAADFAACLGAWGIDKGVEVVVYDDAGGAIAARMWWMLRWLGHERVRILNGGLAAWVAAGHALETKQSAWSSTRYVLSQPRDEWIASTTDIENLSESDRLIDARAAVRFRGEREPIDAVAGHIPGARNLPFTELLDDEGRFKQRAELAQLIEDAISGVEPTAVVAMCGSGVTACLLLAAMEEAQLGPGRLYVGSWSEWSRDSNRPLAS